MKRYMMVFIQFFWIMLLCTPPAAFEEPVILISTGLDNVHGYSELSGDSEIASYHTGLLNPVVIEHTGRAASPSTYSITRTDKTKYPQSEIELPSGLEGNLYSAECNGGHFLVGENGQTDFSSSEGTISLWIKWDITAPNGRFWGQHSDFETRWSNRRLVLDWGSDTTLQGSKTDWVVDKWYFIAIVWNDDTNSLSIYWGDEDTQPSEDASTLFWSGTVIGLLTENNIMCSRASTSYRVYGHVDDFRYYSVQRSLDDIQSDYVLPLVGNEPYLEHYYSFENGFIDSAGESNLIPSGTVTISSDVFYRSGGWRAESVEMSIRNLKRLLALNGSFETGLPGSNVDWTGDGTYYAEGWRARRQVLSYQGRQRTSYINTGQKYIVIENEGYEDPSSPDAYRHYDGTVIYWYQTIDNSQLTEVFEFSMNFLYQRGPIGMNFSNNFEFCFEILNGSFTLWNWSIDPTQIEQRGIWYTINPITVEIPYAPALFEVRVSLKVDTVSGFIGIPVDDPDVDGDSANAMYLTFLIDDLSLVASQIPSFENVDFKIILHPFVNATVSGSSGACSLIFDYEYWNQSSIPFSFSSNSTVSFEYLARIIKMSKVSNSTYLQNLDKEGVLYKANLDQEIELSFSTYMRSYPGIVDVGINARYPIDWDSPFVEDPFGRNLTNEIQYNTGLLEIPSGVAELVGWWSFKLTGHNYASSINTEMSSNSNSTWSSSSIYRNGEKMRSIISLANGLISPAKVVDVEICIFNPSGNLWLIENVSNHESATATSTATAFGPTNASTGTWLITSYWVNGTEVGYGSKEFSLYHQLTIFAQTPNIELEPGETFTASVFLYDQDNGYPILSDAIVVGNWSSTEITFNPNLAKGWWEADFNSSSVDTGDYLILITVNLPFYDIDSCIINVKIPLVESLYEITLRATLIGAVTVFAAFTLIAISRYIYLKIRTKRRLEILALKGRLDDARNMIGLLVIHRTIGLPIYSRIIKGGFQESLLSSFISALSQFRAEFSWDEPKWTALPITEIITVVLTDSLICALITVESSSERQKNQLERFGIEIGGLYDKDEDTLKQMMRSPILSSTVDSIFANYFDGPVLTRYIGVKEELPDRLVPVKEAIQSMDVEKGISAEAIIKMLLLEGYGERMSYSLVLEVIDGNYLVAVNEEPLVLAEAKE
ncbi:hypothetical protein EU527_06810 [Candidatus Thorarchaeota archaeon]|nr:MAG: hypothetical protein EU527_06810 [Candidatus Thorarchaeota archaeon]